MVLSVFDIDNFGFYFDIVPLKKLVDTSLSTAQQQDVQYYDFVLRGNKLGVGREFLEDATQRPLCELDIRGKLRCFEMFMVSDARKKENIVPLEPATCTDALRNTHVYRYNFKGKASQPKVGFIAQQLQTAGLPHLVAEDEEGLTVDQNQLLALVFGAVKDIDARLQAIEEKLAVGPRGETATATARCAAAETHPNKYM